MTSRSRVEWLYASAAIIAVACAVFLSLNIRGADFTYRGAAAVVNGQTISQLELARALDAMQSGLERTLTPQDKTRALQLLIDEELLVQKALELELARDDRLIRKNMAQAMISSVMPLSEVASEEQLRTFYQENLALFSAPKLVTLEVLRANRANQAQAFVSSLANGATFSQAGKELDLQPIEVPAGIPIGKVGAILGGAARDTVNTMEVGDIAGPIDDQLFVWLTAAHGGDRSFTQAKEGVAAEWQRRADEQALQDYLRNLRRSARIKVFDTQPD